MPNADLAQAIRRVLNDYAATDVLIDRLMGIELKESDVATYLRHAVNTMLIKKTEFAAALHAELLGLNATWNAPTYNLVPLHLTPVVRLTATEELSAIRTHAPSPNYDPAKALTNMLRIIKVAER